MDKVTIFCGGSSDEHDVSLMSTKAILEVSKELNYNFSVLYISRERKATFVNKPSLPTQTEIKKYSKSLTAVLKFLSKNTDLAFLGGIHGDFAEDGELQQLLYNAKIRFSGSGISASRLCMNKYRSGKIVESKIPNIKIPKTFFLDELKDYNKLKFPLILKPNANGSSRGLKIVNSVDEIKEFKESKFFKEYLIQEYISNGLELTCGVFQKKDGEFLELPAVEIIPKKSNFFSYESKYEDEGATEICPPQTISRETSSQISKMATDIHITLGCNLYSRHDFIYKDNNLYYLETNTQPGLTRNSLIPKEADAVGLSYPKLIDFLIKNSI